MPKNKFYIGLENSSEVDITFSKKTITEINKLAKRARCTPAELLAANLQSISIAGLAGTAERLRNEFK